MGIFSSPKAPATPPPVIVQEAPAPPAAPTPVDPQVSQSRKDERRRAQASSAGRGGTLLTGPGGLVDDETKTAKTLLGV